MSSLSPNQQQASSPLPTNASTAGAPGSAAARAGLVPIPSALPSGPMQATAENNALIAPIDWQEPDQLAAHGGNQQQTTVLYIGKNRKEAHLPTALLKEKSPYCRRTLAGDSNVANTQFEDLDEFGMMYFMHWLKDPHSLHGPHDFHSLAHYLSLYVVAKKFEVEALENQVMNEIRTYYRTQSMTAPAYRLEYIYTYTPDSNKMREFLVSTAAYRALEDSHSPSNLHHVSPFLHQTFYSQGSFVSESIKDVMRKNSDMAMDFVEAVVRLHRCGEHDPRAGADCDWHVHDQTPKCPVENMEVWQRDGAGDDKPADAPAAPGGPSAPTTPAKPADAKPAEKAADKPADKAADKPADKAADKPADKKDEPKNDDGFMKKMKDHVKAAKDKHDKKKADKQKAKDDAAKKPDDKKADDKKADDKKPADAAPAKK